MKLLSHKGYFCLPSLFIFTVLNSFFLACNTVPKLNEEIDASPKTTLFHPESYDLKSIEKIFRDKTALKINQLEKCEFDFEAEKMLANSPEDLYSTIPAHIRDQPHKYHYCFYYKFILLEKELQSNLFLDEKFQIFMRYYEFIVPLSKIIQRALNDSFYFNFAVHHYIRINNAYFGKKVENELPSKVFRTYETIQ